MKLSMGVVSGMAAFGRTNAPAESSRMSGVEGDAGFDARTTFAKCVGTETFGGEPMTSCVY
jgi:hypothetical protein